MTPVAVDADIAASGLLDGLEGAERAQRAELVAWLMDKGFTVEDAERWLSPILGYEPAPARA